MEVKTRKNTSVDLTT